MLAALGLTGSGAEAIAAGKTGAGTGAGTGALTAADAGVSTDLSAGVALILAITGSDVSVPDRALATSGTSEATRGLPMGAPAWPFCRAAMSSALGYWLRSQ